VDVEAVQVFTSLLSLLALAGAALLVLARLVSSRSAMAREAAVAVSGAGLWLAFVVALGATLGSLYFSEVARYVPCRLCWFQRIAMYPLVPVLLVAAVRRDRAAAWYVLPIAITGLAIAGYHYLLEWRPSLEGGVCSAFGPSCADIWFRQFGFVTLAFMAIAGFVSIIVFTLMATVISPPAQPDAAEAVPSDDLSLYESESV
jgi:disulfide bond formation protein DsbB